VQLVTALTKGSSGPVVWAGDERSCLVFVLGLHLVLTLAGRRLVGARTPVIALSELNRLRSNFVRVRGRARHAPSCLPV